MRMEYKKLKIVLLSAVSVILILSGIFIIEMLRISYAFGGGSFHNFAEYASDDGNNHISIKARNPVWPFGAQEFKIALRGKNCGKKTITASLSNDGKQSHDGEEVKTTFSDDSHAIIIFDGEEQMPETIEIFFDKPNNEIKIIRTYETPINSANEESSIMTW